MHHTGFNDLSLNIVSPVLVTRSEKSMLKSGLIDAKQSALESGISEEKWLNKLEKLENVIDDDSAIVGFYQSAQVGGVKRNNK